MVSSLEKVFPESEPAALKEGSKISGFFGETVSFQLAYRNDCDENAMDQLFRFKIASEIGDKINIWSVELVPSKLPAYEKYDSNYITARPGLYPDLLLSKKDEVLSRIPRNRGPYGLI